ncbi:MAG TPA: hypothetical protein VH619_03200 [Verrucomicrobiae bacterium]|nr:hypothetical protein [Verrucomicrobiae bacterium]
MLTLIYSTNAVPSKESVRQTVLRIGQQYVEGSVERKENLKEFSLTNGYGFYCMFTDASLVGKRLQPDDYRVMGTGEIQLNGNLTGAISLFANEAEGDEFKTMVRIIDSLKVKSKDAK